MNELQEKILKIKQEKNALLLVHNYQVSEIQEIADFLGDSLELCRKAQSAEDVDMIVFCGVDFMAETAKVLNPEKYLDLPEVELILAADGREAADISGMNAPTRIDRIVVRVTIDDQRQVRELHRLGFEIEERGADYLELLVDAEGRSQLETLGYVVESIVYQDGGERTINSFLELSEDLAILAATYPDLTVLTHCGFSVQGRQLWALKVSGNAAEGILIAGSGNNVGGIFAYGAEGERPG